MIKPEFWSDEVLSECSLTARLLFIGTWMVADDYGNLERSAKQLKGQLFPHDQIDCEPLLLELITHGRLIEYSVNGSKYLHIPHFKDHQKINRPSKPRHPLHEDSVTTQEALTESSVSTHPERKLKERERKGERNGALTESSVSTHAMEGEEATPEGLASTQYAAKLLDTLGLPAHGMIALVADAISTEAKFSKIEKPKAFEVIRDAAIAAQNSGGKVDRFWFQDAKWRTHLIQKVKAPKPHYLTTEEIDKKEAMAGHIDISDFQIVKFKK